MSELDDLATEWLEHNPKATEQPIDVIWVLGEDELVKIYKKANNRPVTYSYDLPQDGEKVTIIIDGELYPLD